MISVVKCFLLFIRPLPQSLHCKSGSCFDLDTRWLVNLIYWFTIPMRDLTSAKFVGTVISKIALTLSGCGEMIWPNALKDRTLKTHFPLSKLSLAFWSLTSTLRNLVSWCDCVSPCTIKSSTSHLTPFNPSKTSCFFLKLLISVDIPKWSQLKQNRPRRC